MMSKKEETELLKKLNAKQSELHRMAEDAVHVLTDEMVKALATMSKTMDRPEAVSLQFHTGVELVRSGIECCLRSLNWDDEEVLKYTGPFIGMLVPNIMEADDMAQVCMLMKKADQEEQPKKKRRKK